MTEKTNWPESRSARAVPKVEQLMSWAGSYPARTWAIESAAGLGYLLAQQLVAVGETVVDVPATLASRARLLAQGRSNNNDPNDALSVAVAALRSRGLRHVEAAGQREVLRLLAKRNTDFGHQPCRLVRRDRLIQLSADSDEVCASPQRNPLEIHCSARVTQVELRVTPWQVTGHRANQPRGACLR